MTEKERQESVITEQKVQGTREKNEVWVKGNREYRSDVFSMLLEDPRNALDLYNALNGSDYEDPGMVEVLHLDHGISLSMRNDASFIIDSHLSIYEHQSTYSPNMPLRCLIYFVDQIKDMLKKRDLFSRHRISIPTPHFVVFYNGTAERPEEEVMRLSNAFCHETDVPELEVICRVLNINPRYQEGLKQKSRTLYGYVYFVEQVREKQAEGEALDAAVRHAMEACISEHILEEFFRTRGDEVRKVMHFDMTWERREGLIREEERAEGRMEGRSEGETINLIRQIQRKLKRGKTLLKIADEVEETEEKVRPILEAVQAKGVDCPAEEILACLRKPAD